MLINKAAMFLIMAFLPLIIAAAVSFLLDPLICLFEKKVKRTAATAFAFIALFAVIALAVIFPISWINSCGDGNFFQNIDRRREEISHDIDEFSVELRVKLTDYGVSKNITDSVLGYANEFKAFVTGENADVSAQLMSAAAFIVSLSAALVVAFCFLKDKKKIKIYLRKTICSLFSKKHSQIIFNSYNDFKTVFAGFLLGQLLNALLMNALICIALLLCGIKGAIVIGVLCGVLNIIPYFGGFFSTALSFVAAFASGTPTQAFCAGAIVLFLQYIDGIIIFPKIVGKKVLISPMLVIVAITVGAGLFGFIGVLLAVPTAAFIKKQIDRKIKNFGGDE